MNVRKYTNHEYFLYALILIMFVISCTNENDKTKKFEGFELQETYKEDAVKKVFLYKNEENILRLKIIKNVDEDSAKNLINGEVLTMEALYGNALSPYPGAISNEIVCGSKFMPNKGNFFYNQVNATYFIAYLSERLTYGACAEDLAVYEGVISWAYCSKKREFRQMEFISPKNSFSDAGIDFVKVNICS